ncbi:MAG: prenyltransferase [bacterium]
MVMFPLVNPNDARGPAAPGTIRDLLLLGRLHFPFGGLLLYAFGALIAWRLGADVGLNRVVLGYLVMLPGHLSVSYSNDAFDLEADRSNTPTLFSGGSGVLVRRPELRGAAIAIALGLIAASLVLAVVFSIVHEVDWRFLALVVVGNAVGWFYTAPPLRLIYRGYGEIATAMTVGLLVPVVGYIATGAPLEPELLWLAPMSIAYGVLFVFGVQLPDREADAAFGKPNWTARMRPNTAIVAMAGLCVFATLWLTGIAVALGTVAAGAGGGVTLWPLALASLIPTVTAVAVLAARIVDGGLAAVRPTGPIILGAQMAFMIAANLILA